MIPPTETCSSLAGQLFSIHPLHVGALQAIRDVDPEGAGFDAHPPVDVLDGLPVQLDGAIALVTVSGPIIKRASRYWASHRVLADTFDTLAGLDAVRAAVVLFDTPGGQVSGAAETCDAMDRFKAAGKPLIGQVCGSCFSMGMHLAAHCDAIYAHRMDSVGNIGTRATLFDVSKMFASAGIETVAPDTGEFKSLGVPGLPITAEQRAFLQDYIDRIQTDFRSSLQENGRGLTDEQYAAVADGRFWLAADALELHLIDGIQTTDETLATLRAQLETSKSGSQIMTTPTAPAAATATSEQPVAAEAATDATPAAAAPAAPQANTAAAGNPPAAESTTGTDKTLGEYMAAFGDGPGARFYADGVPFADATLKHEQSKSAALSQEVDQLKQQLADNSQQSHAAETVAAAAAVLGIDQPIETAAAGSGDAGEPESAFEAAIKIVK